MGIGDLITQADEALAAYFGQWNNYSTGIVTVLVLILSYALYTKVEPDTHPMLLSRQAQGSPVRNEGESPIYRGNSAPHGMPLNTGLNVKSAGAPKWSLGRNGDLRDVWRRVISGAPEGEGPAGKGRILTVLGAQRVEEHKLDDITRAINLIGQHLSTHGASKVAIYLPNSVELVAAIFACSFYNMSAIVLPFDRPETEVISMLQTSGADSVITAPGSFPFDLVVKSYPALRQLVWVVDEGSSHMDWNEVPQGMGGKINVSTWQDILSENPVDSGSSLPESTEASDLKDIVMFWQSESGSLKEMVSFTHDNLVAAISAQLTAVPPKHRLSPADLFLPAGPLSSSFTLILTLAALYSNASVAFNSVAGQAPDLDLATTGVAPTVVVATPQTLVKTHNETKGRIASFLSRTSHWVQTRSLVQNGAMPAASFLSQYNDSIRPQIGAQPGKLRLVYVAHPAGTDAPLLSEATLSDLRVFTGARVIYALATAKCAGSVAQTQVYDYRMHGDGETSHFGPPVSSAEVVFKDSGSHKITDENYSGGISVRGPSVAGGEADLGVIGKMNYDNTVVLV